MVLILYRYCNVQAGDVALIKRTILSFINTFNEMGYRNMISGPQEGLQTLFLQV